MAVSVWLVVSALVVCLGGLVLRSQGILGHPALFQTGRPKGSELYGAFYAFGLGMLPWNKESGRLHPVVFWIGVLMHLGIAFGIATLSVRLLVGGIAPEWWAPYGLTALGLGSIAAVLLVRRMVSPGMRRLSTPDDFVAASLTAGVCITAGLWSLGSVPVLVFDLTATAILLYVPLGKLRHMLTFFVSRFYHAKQLGALGVYAPGQRKLFGTLTPGGPIRPGEEPFSDNGTGPSLPVTFEATDLEQLVRHFDDVLSREAVAMLDACVHCAMCTESCHYYMATGDRSLIPVEKLDHLARLYRRKHDGVGRALPALTHALEADQNSVMALHEAAYEHCSMCGRCALSCPMGINTGFILGQARMAFGRIGKMPVGLDKPARTAVKTGNYLALEVEEVVDNLEWFAEELTDDPILEGTDVVIPVDQKGADVLFIPHPLELRDFPFAVMAAAKIFLKAGTSFTFSSEHFDVVNYAYYGGDEGRMREIIQHLVTTAEGLGVKRVVLSPCGHGYKVLRWDAERVLERTFPFEVVSIAEEIDAYLQDGRLTLAKDTEETSVTYHDPCNLGRNGGVIEEPRRIIQAMTSRLVEMRPGGAHAYCCGGGGGLSASGDYGKTRLTAGRVKARQILDTKADVVVTNCFNCNSQIKELTRQHDLGVEVRAIHEYVAGNLV
jgi:Fe-S oxidoreductase